MRWRQTMFKQIMVRVGRLAWLFVVTGLSLHAASVFAQDVDPGTDRAETFVPVEGPQVEDVPGGPLMVGAYALLWILVFGYLFMLSRRARNLEARIAQLESRRT